MKKIIILIIAIGSFTAANCQGSVIKTSWNEQQAFTVQNLIETFKGKDVIVLSSETEINEVLSEVEKDFLTKKFNYTDALIFDFYENFYIKIESADCIARFEKTGTNFLIEINCNPL